jgi:hypothetical protein
MSSQHAPSVQIKKSLRTRLRQKTLKFQRIRTKSLKKLKRSLPKVPKGLFSQSSTPCLVSPAGGDVSLAIDEAKEAEQDGLRQDADEGAESHAVEDGTDGPSSDDDLDFPLTNAAESPAADARQDAPRVDALQSLVRLSVKAAEADDMTAEPRLVDLASGMVHSLPMSGVVSVGRSLDCDIVLSQPDICERHLIFIVKQGRVEVEDIGSEGVLVNETLVPKGEFLPQRIPLRREDTITLSPNESPNYIFFCQR